MKLAILLGLFFSVNAVAGTEHFSYSIQDINVVAERAVAGGFSTVHVAGVEHSKKVGEPELPVQSVLLMGRPQDIHPQVAVLGQQIMTNVKPMPVQLQKCRCEADKQLKFQFKRSAYAAPKAYELTYLGAFRGVPVTRLDVPMAHYEASTNSVKFFNDVKIDHDSAVYSQSSRATYNDYLIITPDNLAAGVTDFVAWKESQGYNVTVHTLATPEFTLKAISDVIADAYKNKGADFAILIGNENILPMHKVSTSGGTTTTDIKYYLMDGATDTIPDMFYSRIAATTPEDVQATLAKAIEFDKQVYTNTAGLHKIIGIASDEGRNPSDNEYVTSIEDKMKTVLGYTADHFYQDDSKSNPTDLNKSISEGALWMVYLGHGSGTSWPSLGRDYDVTDIPLIANRNSVKPIVIDVACQNGRLLPGYMGTTFSSVLAGDASGAAAYYGGTVNISWHPPAIMARGIAYEHAAKNFRHLGEALLAGQMYLAANNNNQKEVQDNFNWYQLQGDPGMIISH